MTTDAPLDISISHVAIVDAAGSDGEVVARLAGELDITAEGLLLDRLAASLSEHPDTRARVDLSDVSFVDSSGLRALLMCRQHADSVGVPFELTVVDGPVTRLLDLSGLGTYFTFRPPRPLPDRR